MKQVGYFGYLEIIATTRNGSRYIYKTPNTLTYTAKNIMSHVLVGDSISTIKVSKLAVGTGITPPQRSNTSLEHEIVQEPIETIIYPAPGQIELVTFLDFNTPANGQILTEAGLMSADGLKMFARQIHTGVTKDDNFKLEYRWRVVFT